MKKDNIKKPSFCVIEVSHKCMFRCKMCNYWKTDSDPEEIKIEELFRFIASLRDFVDTPFEMNISGGEPLLKEGMLDLVEFIAKKGFKFSLVTNGYLLDNGVAKRIADSGLSFLAVSLDSLNEKNHDFLRGTKGACKKVMNSLEQFTAYRGRLQNLTIQTIIMGPNLDDILDLVKWTHNKHFTVSLMAITRPNMLPVDPEWYKKEEYSFLWPRDISQAQGVIDELIKLKKKGHNIDNPIGQLEGFKSYFSDPESFIKAVPCNLGEGIIHLNPRGDVYLCCEMEPIGNIKECDIKEIWTSQKADHVRKKIKLCKKNCAGMVNCYADGWV